MRRIFSWMCYTLIFFFSSRRRHTRLQGDWSSDVCSSDLGRARGRRLAAAGGRQQRGDGLRLRGLLPAGAGRAPGPARGHHALRGHGRPARHCASCPRERRQDRKSTRLNSSHLVISYAVFCLKKKRPYAFLAELTYRCPLHCPYCSNPARARSGEELTTNEWRRVFRETTELGVLQVGGEPLVRRDLAELVHAARETRLYTNLITSGIGLNESRADELRAAGLDSVQLSFQAADVDLADEIAGARAHQLKLSVAAYIRAAGIPLGLNFVIHRRTRWI